MTLYGIYCRVCHSPNPSTAIAPFNLIMVAANNPDQITAASSTYSSQMGFINTTLSQTDLQNLAAYIGTFLSTQTTIDIIEFYDASLDHYFISASSPEISDLDHGIHPGWVRTGLGFKAHPASGNAASPVCRFYIPPAYGDSHFYSASPAECAQVQGKFPFFDYESPGVFYMDLPDSSSGVCVAGTIPVYRVWDNRPDTNHRYTTSSVVRLRMESMGWIAEGYGPNQVIMCSPL